MQAIVVDPFVPHLEEETMAVRVAENQENHLDVEDDEIMEV